MATAVKKRRKGPVRTGYKHDWPTICRAFVEGVRLNEDDEEKTFLQLNQIAERFGVPVQQVKHRSSTERWFEQREDYQRRMVRARQARRVLELAGESVEFDSKALSLAKLGMATVTTRMAEIAREVEEQQVRRIEALELIAAGKDADPGALMSAIDARELEVLARAASQWQQVGQKALGTDVQRMDIQQDIQVDAQITSISAELSRDDPERLAGFLQAAKRAGLLADVMKDDPEPLGIEAPSEGDVVDAEIVE